MRIGVTIEAASEGKPAPLPYCCRPRAHGVAFLAGNMNVRSRQRKTCLRVVDFLRRLPVVRAVAAQTIGAKSSLMFVLVTGSTTRRQPQERTVLVFYRDQRSIGSQNPLRIVTFRAIQSHVLSGENPSSLRVVESRLAWNPADQLEVFAIVFRVALCALDAAGLIVHHRGVIAAISSQTLRDLFVTIHAAKFRCADFDRMTRNTTCRAAQVFMRP